jgi:hypothetical protein
MTPATDRSEINRANAQHSTGPKTPEGKQRSSQNALRHGLTGQLVVMPDEDLQAYQHHLASFIDEYDPQGSTEDHLVQSLADVSWRLNRIGPLEANLLSICYTPAGLVDGLFDQAKAMANLSLHSQRLARQFERTVAQLRELQSARRTQEKQDLEAFLDIKELYEDKGEIYNPSADGFVFSKTQIASATQARKRERLVEEAWDRHLEKAAA